MKICYIISTCNKYLDTRVQYQMDAMCKNVNKEDIYYLTSTPNIERRQFGWYTMDHLENVAWKYIYFIHNSGEELADYDWYLFIHDDTFIFHDRIKNLLEKYNNPGEHYYIGKEEEDKYMSGKAGFALSKGLYSLIVGHIKNVGINNAYYPIISTKCEDSAQCFWSWIQDIAQENKVTFVNNELFHSGLHENDYDLDDAVSFHNVTTKELYDFYSAGIFTEKNALTTVFTLVTDANYFNKAKRTIIDLRSKGRWIGDVVLITLDFDLNANFKEFYNITEVKFPQIDKSVLLGKIGPSGFSNSDKREIHKLNQWEKLHVFDKYFMKWSRVVFLDAGLRILDDVSYLLELDYKGKLLAPKDGKLYNHQDFNCQLSYDRPELIEELVAEYGDDILTSTYMLNCIWIYDTAILKICNKSHLIDAMNKYAFCRTNEMGVMNIMFHFKYKLWERMAIKASNGKILFDWCELNNPDIPHWREYCYIKYPVTISFEDT